MTDDEYERDDDGPKAEEPGCWVGFGSLLLLAFLLWGCGSMLTSGSSPEPCSTGTEEQQIACKLDVIERFGE